MSPEDARGPSLVTVAYLGYWYYLLLFVQRGTKYRLQREYKAAGKTFDRYFGGDPRMLAADRAVANTQEQMVPFLVSLWMFASVVSPTLATILGAVYCGLRAMYPILLGKRIVNMQPKRVYWATLPCYAIILAMLGATAWAAVN